MEVGGHYQDSVLNFKTLEYGSRYKVDLLYKVN